MCQHREMSSSNWTADLPRRNFLKLLGTATFGLSFVNHLSAAEKAPPPKTLNVLSPDAALERLLKGNHRYVEGTMKRRDFAKNEPRWPWARTLLLGS
jgi:carbonic anhydrase